MQTNLRSTYSHNGWTTRGHIHICAYYNAYTHTFVQTPDSNDIDALEDLHTEDSAGGADEGKGRSRTGLRPCASFTTLKRPRKF